MGQSFRVCDCPGMAIFLGDNYHRRQFSGRAIIRGSITQGAMDGGGGQLSGEQFSSGEIFRIPFLPVEGF